MTLILQAEAVRRAEAFIAEHRKKYRCGAVQSVRHVPLDERDRKSGRTEGSFYVKFEYRGPKPKVLSLPRRDHPTVVLVGDVTGECRIMMWL